MFKLPEVDRITQILLEQPTFMVTQVCEITKKEEEIQKEEGYRFSDNRLCCCAHIYNL
jgi:predicted methyltransferase